MCTCWLQQSTVLQLPLIRAHEHTTTLFSDYYGQE